MLKRAERGGRGKVRKARARVRQVLILIDWGASRYPGQLFQSGTFQHMQMHEIIKHLQRGKKASHFKYYSTDR